VAPSLAAAMAAAGAAALATAFFLLAWCPVADASEDELVPIYFGCGCFWHVQHEFILAEQTVLERAASELTAVSGYAGGTRLNPDGKACYYDYGGNGHTEVVELLIPRDSVASFAAVFWSLFVGKNRIDTMDIGPSYRAAVGLPGGISSPLLAVVNSSQEGHVAQPFQLLEGHGMDRDTLGEALVWVYDSDHFPFHQAELYHQFHDDFMPGGNYPDHYNKVLKKAVLEACRMLPTNCPADVAQPPDGCSVEGGSSQTSSDDDPDTGGTLGGGSGGSGGSGTWRVNEDTSQDQRSTSSGNEVSTSSGAGSFKLSSVLFELWIWLFVPTLGLS